MWVDRQEQALSSTSDHNSKRGRHIETGDAGVLVLRPRLIVVLPYLIEVEGIEELDRAVKGRHD